MLDIKMSDFFQRKKKFFLQMAIAVLYPVIKLEFFYFLNMILEATNKKLFRLPRLFG